MSVKFVIVGAARTGSTFLVQTMNGLDGICCHGEIFATHAVRGFVDGFSTLFTTPAEREERAARLLRERVDDPVAFLRSALSRDSRATGFKALYWTLLNPRSHRITDSLLAIPDIRFIHLLRRNNLRRFVSEQIMRAGGPVHSGPGGRMQQRMKVHIEIADFQHNCIKVKRQQEAIQALILDKDILEVAYEDLSKDTSRVVAEICQFLGLNLTHRKVDPALQKVGSADLRESVSNFQELLGHEATRDLVLRD